MHGPGNVAGAMRNQAGSHGNQVYIITTGCVLLRMQLGPIVIAIAVA